VYSLCCVVVFGYLAATRHAPNRPGMVIVVMVALVAAFGFDRIRWHVVRPTTNDHNALDRGVIDTDMPSVKTAPNTVRSGSPDALLHRGPSDPYVPLVAAYGSSKPRRACQA
jgi:hypothetical protein